MDKLLKGIVVLDMTQAYSGPFCAMNLADHGATVIKIERPGAGDQTRNWGPFKNDYSAYFAFLNRNKQGLTLNFTTAKGKKILLELVKNADVLCENFRVGTLEKYGLGYEDLAKVNPRLIYASISGYGTTGPYAARPAYDIVAQAMSGMMSITGYPENPPVKIGPSVGDNYSGTYLALGVSMALYNREKTGKGHRIDVAMFDTLYSVLENAVVTYTVGGEEPMRAGNSDPALAPFDAFQAKDGQVVLGCGTDAMWERLAQAMGRPELAKDPRFASNDLRCRNYMPALKEAVEAWSTTKTKAELEEIIVGIGIPFGQIQTVSQATEHPQIAARNMVQTINDPVIGPMRVPGIPIKVRGISDAVEKPAPTLGQDTDTLLGNLGYDKAAIESLRSEGIV